MTGEGHGTVYVVGIGPGLPAHLTERARSTIHSADVVYAAPLYQSFLQEGGVLPQADSRGAGGCADDRGSGPEVLESRRGSQGELAREAFERARSGADVVHVSGGDPNVFGKSDLLFSVATEEGYTDVEIEVIPGVTAALGGAASLGSPLSNDFAVVSLADSWREWGEIEQKLRGAAEAGFVLVLYNAWRDLDRAVEVIREMRADEVPVAVLTDIGRGDAGRSSGGESATISTLGSLMNESVVDRTPGMLVIVGTGETSVVETDHGRFLLTPRGDIDIEAI